MRIVKYPHPTLRHKSKPLRRVDAELHRIVRQMFDLMYENKGIGLAANQVDLPYRMFILNLSGEPTQPEQEMVFLNPVITRHSGTVEAEEGCLSFPEIYATVKRAQRITISAYNLAGQEIHQEATGLLGRAVQHEYDHLEGILLIDRLTPSRLAAIRGPLEDLELGFAGDRQRGVIPDDREISARLTELEALRA